MVPKFGDPKWSSKSDIIGVLQFAEQSKWKNKKTLAKTWEKTQNSGDWIFKYLQIFIYLCLTSKNNRTISDQGIDFAYQSTPTNQEIFRILPEVPQPHNHLSSAGWSGGNPGAKIWDGRDGALPQEKRHSGLLTNQTIMTSQNVYL